MDYFYRFMKSKKLGPEERFEAYVRGIRLFMVHGHVPDAYSIYNRMQDEGYIPPCQIQATMFVLQTLSTGDSTEVLLEAAAKAFSQESFNEKEFRYLLRIISSVTRLPSTLYDDLIQLFIASRKESSVLSAKTESLLAFIRTRRGWSGHVPQTGLTVEEATLAQRTTSREQEIESLLSMAGDDAEIAPIIHSTVRRIRHSNGTYDRIFYNVMISALADRRRYTEVFTVYNTMIRGDASILPDVYTFGTLFRVIARFSATRTIHNRKHKRPGDAPTMRELYRDMVYCHRIQTKDVTARTPVMRGSLLNKILRNFVRSGDFAAAYVVLRSYQIFMIPVTLATYRSVLGGIMLRLQKELPALQPWNCLERYWAYRFMGSPTMIPKEADARVMDGVLNFSAKAALQLDPIKLYSEQHLQHIAEAVQYYIATKDDSDVPELTYRKISNKRPKRAGYRVPTAVTLLGILDPPVDLWDVQPLLRIVRRAILASRSRLFLHGTRVVSMEIRYARTEMLPAFAPPTKEIQRPRVLNM